MVLKRSNTTVKTPYTNRLLAANQGPGDVAQLNEAVRSGTYQANPGRIVKGYQTPRSTNMADVAAARRGTILNRAAGQGYKPPAAPVLPGLGGSGGSRGGGGGGGAGGLTQAQLDWLAAMLGKGRPQATAATNLDLPDFQGQFNNAQYEQLRSGLSQALGQASQVGQQATQNLTNFLNQNYTNPYAQGPPQQQAPGMTQEAMGRFLSSQGGISPDVANAEAQGRAAANQGFQNYWGGMSAGEDVAQRNRLANATQMGGDVANRIEGERIAGTTGIGMQEAQARSAYEQALQERNWQTAQQEALQNWQRQNQVTDLNASNTNAYTNQVLQAMLGLVPQAPGADLSGLMAQLGMG